MCEGISVIQNNIYYSKDTGSVLRSIESTELENYSFIRK